MRNKGWGNYIVNILKENMYYYFFYHISTMGLYWQEKETLLMNDFGLRMANALPFKRQPDRMAQRVSDLSATDWRYETHIKKTIVIWHVSGYSFSRGWTSLYSTAWVCLIQSDYLRPLFLQTTNTLRNVLEHRAGFTLLFTAALSLIPTH